MTTAMHQAQPVPSSGYDAYLTRTDATRRGLLVRRNRLFLTTLLREHPNLAKKAVEEAEKAKRAARRARAQARIVKPALSPPAETPAPEHAPSQAEILRACKLRRGPGMAIVHEIAALHGLEPADLLGLSRKYPIAAARFHAMYEIYRRLDYSSPQIGALFQRDHSTILHAIKRWPQVRQRADVVARLNAAAAAPEAR